WYQAADLYVMSSITEGFPNSLIEAMSYGLPVISFDCDVGPRDIIKHKFNGLLVEQGSVEKLSCAINELMNDVNKRKLYGNNALLVDKQFSIKKVSDMWILLFDKIRYEARERS